jgi:hypothetical protein
MTSADSKNKGFEFELKVSINSGGSGNSDTDGANATEVLRAADMSIPLGVYRIGPTLIFVGENKLCMETNCCGKYLKQMRRV